jgi:hypothetical protein
MATGRGGARMTRLPDLAPGQRVRLPAGTVVYHGSCLELADGIFATGLRPYKPAGPYGNWRASPEPVVRQQPAGIYVARALIEAVPWAGMRGGTPCVWKINASDLTATGDLRYPGNARILRLVGRCVPPERLFGLYDCSRDAWVSVSLANRPETAL